MIREWIKNYLLIGDDQLFWTVISLLLFIVAIVITINGIMGNLENEYVWSFICVFIGFLSGYIALYLT